MQRLSITHLEGFVTAILVAAGVILTEAEVVAKAVVDAEARGYESHGLMRIGSYIDAMKNGETVSPLRLEVLRESVASVVWDGHRGCGHVAALRAMEECTTRAKIHGSCIGLLRNVGHVGRLGYYVEAATEHGVIGFMACSLSHANAVVAPWGGREPRLSTNPLAFGFPYLGGDTVVIDVSTTQAARGKVLLAAASNDPIPDTWALDAAGNPTTDPNQALPPEGTLAPIGGHKGYGLSIAVELLCNALGGLNGGGASTTVFIGAYDLAHLTSEEEYALAVRSVDEAMRSSALRPGFDAIRLPGARSAEERRQADDLGVKVPLRTWQALCGAAESVGVEIPPP